MTAAEPARRCHHDSPCPAPAVGRLVAPDGWQGSAMCAEHAAAVVDEYREKLGWEWRFELFPQRNEVSHVVL